jgi:hypothetical protein
MTTLCLGKEPPTHIEKELHGLQRQSGGPGEMIGHPANSLVTVLTELLKFPGNMKKCH